MPGLLSLQVAPHHTRSSHCIDSNHPSVIAFAEANRGGTSNLPSQAVSLYYAIRDAFYYNPWSVQMTRDEFKASAVLTRDRALGAHCIDKATLLAACARHLGIPTVLHFANVRNHIGTQRLEEKLGTNLLVFHGYVELHLEGQWVAATPAFNKGLCDKLGVAPLEFDGRSDSIFQQFDRRGGQFMEYVHDYGVFEDIPYDFMVGEWTKHYPAFAEVGTWPRR